MLSKWQVIPQEEFLKLNDETRTEEMQEGRGGGGGGWGEEEMGYLEQTMEQELSLQYSVVGDQNAAKLLHHCTQLHFTTLPNTVPLEGT